MNAPVAKTKWNAGLYDQKHDFVYKFGEDVVQLLAPAAGERILDLGCGTGHLTNVIAASGATVIGIDSSAEMVVKAKKTYPSILFEVKDATSFQFDVPFDAIFSNAVLHWVTEKNAAVRCIYNNLKSGGRLVLEMGAKENISHIITALKEVLREYGYVAQASKELWYFPSLSEYTTHLENAGLIVHYATYFKRDTELKDNENGIVDWLKMFASPFLEDVRKTELSFIMGKVQERLRPTNYKNNKWYADYYRLRIVAAKP